MADRILVLNEGAVDSLGTHEELRARKGRVPWQVPASHPARAAAAAQSGG